MSKEIFNALELLEKEKGIPKDYMLEKISQALLTAYKRDHDGASENVVVEPDLAKRELKMYVQKTVVEDIEDPETEITLADAHDYARAPQIGDVVNIEVPTMNFGRIAANDRHQPLGQQTAAHFSAQTACSSRNRVEYDRTPQPLRRARRQQHRFLCAQRTHIERKRIGMCGDLLHLALILRHDGCTTCRKDDIRAIVDGHVIGNRMHHRANRLRTRYDLLYPIRHRSAPSNWLNTCVRLSAARTKTEIAAPTAVETRKDGTKVKSAAALLFISTAAIG